MRARFLPDFWIDVVEAAEWFDEQRPGLGREFVAAVDASIDTVLENPRTYRAVHAPTRRFIIKRFRHSCSMKPKLTTCSSSGLCTVLVR